MVSYRRFIFSIFFLIFSLSISCKEPDVPGTMGVELAIDKSYIINSNSQPIEVKGDPIEIVIKCIDSAIQINRGYYVHIFQKNIVDNKYFYMGTIGFFKENVSKMRVWLGASQGINQTFEVFAIINKTASYVKDESGIKIFNKLPGNIFGLITIKRIE